MIVSDRLRAIREEKNLSQGDIEKRSGLLRCYVSRVENGHTVPAIETLEKMARALEVPLYRLFYEGDEPLAIPGKPQGQSRAANEPDLSKFYPLFDKMTEGDRQLLLLIARRMVLKRAAKAKRT
jgi:transcriptional regulator with XRE-family HTH domain